MMVKEYWDEIKGIGKMYMEIELVVGVETVLFVCINDEGRWLFMTYDSAEGDYVFCRIEESTLIRMLNNEITMEEAYRRSGYIGETFIDEEGRMRFYKYASDSFSGGKLPSKGAYYDIRSEYINEYICKLQRCCGSRYEIIDYSYGEEPIGNLSLDIAGNIILNEVVMNWYKTSFNGDNDMVDMVIDYIKNSCIMAQNAVEELSKIMMPIKFDADQDKVYFSDLVNMAA